MNEKKVRLIEINSLLLWLFRCSNLLICNLTFVSINWFYIFMMPQFDVFSFLSQLFWVFLGFLLFYLLICFYLLPSLAAILKIRKRKLIQVSADQNSTLIMDTNFISFTRVSLDIINVKLSSLQDTISNSKVTPSLTKSLGVFTLKLGSLSEFNFLLFNRAQLTYLLFG